MQISDLVKQYHQAISSGAETLTGTKGVENLVASLRSLTKGNIFEGTVTSVKNGRVTLSLSRAAGDGTAGRKDFPYGRGIYVFPGKVQRWHADCHPAVCN